MSEKRNDHKKNGEAPVDEKDIKVEFGAGKISFGGLFQGIGNIIDLVSRLEQEGKKEENQEGEFTSPSGRVKAVYGFSVKTSPGGKPTVEPFGNVKKTARGPVVEEDRQPLVDIFDEQDHVIVIVELPGIEQEHIHTSIQGDILTLSAANDNRKYSKEVLLPKDVDAATLQSKYKNGVLELRINKK